MENNPYNEEPVYYCKHCLSLRIKTAPHCDLPYCESCNSTFVDQISIEEWESLYKERYGINYLKSKKNGRS